MSVQIDDEKIRQMIEKLENLEPRHLGMSNTLERAAAYLELQGRRIEELEAAITDFFDLVSMSDCDLPPTAESTLKDVIEDEIEQKGPEDVDDEVIEEIVNAGEAPYPDKGTSGYEDGLQVREVADRLRWDNAEKDGEYASFFPQKHHKSLLDVPIEVHTAWRRSSRKDVLIKTGEVIDDEGLEGMSVVHVTGMDGTWVQHPKQYRLSNRRNEFIDTLIDGHAPEPEPTECDIERAIEDYRAAKHLRRRFGTTGFDAPHELRDEFDREVTYPAAKELLRVLSLDNREHLSLINSAVDIVENHEED